jgi:hypothetical protein
MGHLTRHKNENIRVNVNRRAQTGKGRDSTIQAHNTQPLREYSVTPDQEKKFEIMLVQNQQLHDFWYEPNIAGGPPRTEQLDKILSMSRGTTFAGKVLMAGFGIVATVATTWAAFKFLMGIE